MEFDQAKQAMIDAAPGEDRQEHGGTLDEFADAFLTRMAQFFGECAGGDTFCGISVDEVRNEQGVLQELRLVPCDMIDGTAVRRAAR